MSQVCVSVTSTGFLDNVPGQLTTIKIVVKFSNKTVLFSWIFWCTFSETYDLWNLSATQSSKARPKDVHVSNANNVSKNLVKCGPYNSPFLKSFRYMYINLLCYFLEEIPYFLIIKTIWSVLFRFSITYLSPLLTWRRLGNLWKSDIRKTVHSQKP